MKIIKHKNIEIFKEDKFYSKTDYLINEVPFNIYVNNFYYSTLMVLPSFLKELCVGFLFTDALIKDIDEISDINIISNNAYINLKQNNINIKRRMAITSGCGGGSLHLGLIENLNLDKVSFEGVFNSSQILNLVNKFNRDSTLFFETGGVHGAALCDNEIIIRMDDIGRHNAVDKVIGYSILNKIDMNNKFIITSGRISSDMVIKAVKAKIPIVVSASAPTSLAVDIANLCSVTLIGFARYNRFNVYTNKDRIV